MLDADQMKKTASTGSEVFGNLQWHPLVEWTQDSLRRALLQLAENENCPTSLVKSVISFIEDRFKDALLAGDIASARSFRDLLLYSARVGRDRECSELLSASCDEIGRTVIHLLGGSVHYRAKQSFVSEAYIDVVPKVVAELSSYLLYLLLSTPSGIDLASRFLDDVRSVTDQGVFVHAKLLKESRTQFGLCLFGIGFWLLYEMKSNASNQFAEAVRLLHERLTHLADQLSRDRAEAIWDIAKMSLEDNAQMRFGWTYWTDPKDSLRLARPLPVLTDDYIAFFAAIELLTCLHGYQDTDLRRIAKRIASPERWNNDLDGLLLSKIEETLTKSDWVNSFQGLQFTLSGEDRYVDCEVIKRLLAEVRGSTGSQRVKRLIMAPLSSKEITSLIEGATSTWQDKTSLRKVLDGYGITRQRRTGTDLPGSETHVSVQFILGKDLFWSERDYGIIGMDRVLGESLSLWEAARIIAFLKSSGSHVRRWISPSDGIKGLLVLLDSYISSQSQKGVLVLINGEQANLGASDILEASPQHITKKDEKTFYKEAQVVDVYLPGASPAVFMLDVSRIGNLVQLLPDDPRAFTTAHGPLYLYIDPVTEAEAKDAYTRDRISTEKLLGKIELERDLVEAYRRVTLSEYIEFNPEPSAVLEIIVAEQNIETEDSSSECS